MIKIPLQELEAIRFIVLSIYNATRNIINSNTAFRQELLHNLQALLPETMIYLPCVFVPVYVSMCLYVCVYVRTCVIHVSLCVCVRAGTCLHVFECVGVGVCVCVCVLSLIHI